MEGIFTGRYIKSFADTGRDLPIWIASYVVADYGTGIVNASVHDERDFAFAKKFNIPLTHLPTLMTIRGRSHMRDGRIHTDTKAKIISVLLYMNSQWENQGGRLRLLKNGHDLDDYITEIPPVEGTLLGDKSVITDFSRL